MKKNTTILRGGSFTDQRGTLFFNNDFNMKEIVRFYMIEHPDISVIRAWQGHKKEQKWFSVVSGSFKVALVQPDDWENPSKELVAEEFILKTEDCEVLHIPGGFANGFKAIEPGSKMIVYSDYNLEESAADNFRFESTLWYDWENEKYNTKENI